MAHHIRREEERVALIREFGVHRFTAMLYPHKPGMAHVFKAHVQVGAYKPSSELLDTAWGLQ